MNLLELKSLTLGWPHQLYGIWLLINKYNILLNLCTLLKFPYFKTLQNEQPLQVARCTKIINADSDDPKYIINVKQFAKFVVDLADSVAPTDIEEGMRVGSVYFVLSKISIYINALFTVWIGTSTKSIYLYPPRLTLLLQ